MMLDKTAVPYNDIFQFAFIVLPVKIPLFLANIREQEVHESQNKTVVSCGIFF
jgi:hypothetical protein